MFSPRILVRDQRVAGVLVARSTLLDVKMCPRIWWLSLLEEDGDG